MNTLVVDGQQFRDLDHDGVLSPYEDHRLPVAARVADLLGRMTLAEKAGIVMHGTARSNGPLGAIGVGSAYDLEATSALIKGHHISHMITRLSADPATLAAENNRLQDIAAATRLGIPMTISTDPRHHFQAVTGASSSASGFSEWPETTGLAAIGSSDLTAQFGDIVRTEYRAVGIHLALSPQADIASEPRWPRITGTFGQDPALARELVHAYVHAVQGNAPGLTRDGVACVVKHWVGYPAAPEGFDGHNHYGRFSTVTAETLPQHIEPFLGAFSAGVAGVMPTYCIQQALELNGKKVEQVAGGYSRELVTDLLRGTHNFAGFVLSDWAIYRDATDNTITAARPQGPDDIATCWGVEDLGREARFARSLHAGVDQFGGEEDTACLVRAIESGLVAESRLDESVSRLLTVKFTQGLFDNPWVDAGIAGETVGNTNATTAGQAAQRRAVICLKKPAQPGEAEIVRLASPRRQLHPNHFFGARQDEGDLDYQPDDPAFRNLLSEAAEKPTVAVIRMNRPTIVAPFIDKLDGLFVDLGVRPEIMDSVIRSGAATEATLPFELPASMEAVRATRPDVPGGSEAPTFKCRSDYRNR